MTTCLPHSAANAVLRKVGVNANFVEQCEPLFAVFDLEGDSRVSGAAAAVSVAAAGARARARARARAHAHAHAHAHRSEHRYVTRLYTR